MSSRRDALRSIAGAAGLAAAASAQQNSHQHADANTSQPGDKPLIDTKKPKQPGFFNKEEFETLGELVELIIPRTDTPGAKDAGVHFLIDERVPNNAPREKAWRDGIALFQGLSPSQRLDLLTRFSNEHGTDGRRFFDLLKAAAVEGYYETREGLAMELGWHGNTFLKEFTGCTHPEHQIAKSSREKA